MYLFAHRMFFNALFEFVFCHFYKLVFHYTSADGAFHLSIGSDRHKKSLTSGAAATTLQHIQQHKGSILLQVVNNELPYGQRLAHVLWWLLFFDRGLIKLFLVSW